MLWALIMFWMYIFVCNLSDWVRDTKKSKRGFKKTGQKTLQFVPTRITLRLVKGWQGKPATWIWSLCIYLYMIYIMLCLVYPCFIISTCADLPSLHVAGTETEPPWLLAIANDAEKCLVHLPAEKKNSWSQIERWKRRLYIIYIVIYVYIYIYIYIYIYLDMEICI